MQYSYTSSSASGYHTNFGLLYFGLIILIIEIIAYWKMFVKAGEPGWKAIIPIYNIVIAFKIAGKNPYMVFLLLIPIVNIFVIGYLYINLGRTFGKDAFWSIILLYILNPIGQLILGFGKSTYMATGAPLASIHNPPQTIPQQPVSQ